MNLNDVNNWCLLWLICRGLIVSILENNSSWVVMSFRSIITSLRFSRNITSILVTWWFIIIQICWSWKNVISLRLLRTRWSIG